MKTFLAIILIIVSIALLVGYWSYRFSYCEGYVQGRSDGMKYQYSPGK